MRRGPHCKKRRLRDRRFATCAKEGHSVYEKTKVQAGSVKLEVGAKEGLSVYFCAGTI